MSSSYSHKRGGNFGKTYESTTNELREYFIRLWVNERMTIKQAAKKCGIKYGTAKNIVAVWRKDGRTEKKRMRPLAEEAINGNQFDFPRPNAPLL